MKKNSFYFYLKLIFLCVFTSFLHLNAQENEKFKDLEQSWGVFGAYIFNFHDANFKALPEIPNCCPLFTGGYGRGFQLGIFSELKLPYNLSIALRGVYVYNNGELIHSEKTYVRVENDTVPGTFEHYLYTEVVDIGLSPILNYNIGRFSLSFGGYLGATIGSYYKQYERITEPKDVGVFIDTRTRIRNKFEGKIPKVNTISSSILTGISYSLPLNKSESFCIIPEIFLHLGTSNIVDGLAWRINSIRAGISIKYTPKEPPPPPPPPPIEEFEQKTIIDTITIISDNIEKSYIKIGKEKIIKTQKTENNKIIFTDITYRTDTLIKKQPPQASLELNTSEINVREQFVTETFPILNHIYFDLNSDEINNQYKTCKDPKEFSFDKLPSNPVDLHYQTLNIVGYRMQKNPSTELILKGFADKTTENANCKLARNRANSIKKYLVEFWKIDPNRIKILGKENNCFPDNPTTSQNDSGFAENRRVEIYSNNTQILEPIIKKHFIEVTDIYPQELVFNPGHTLKKSSPTSISQWSFKLYQGNTIIFEQNFLERPENFTLKTKDIISNLNFRQPLIAELYINDADGNESIAQQELVLKKDTSSYEVVRFSLILFDFFSDALSEKAKKEVSEFLKNVDSSSALKITGYTDILGPEEINLSLSKNRAMNTANYILQKFPHLKIVSIDGVGAKNFPPGITSYKSPVERAQSRTVQIEVLKKTN